MTQTERILAHMKQSPITPLYALREFGCLRLEARINDLRNRGHLIDTEIVHRHGKSFAQYRLIDQPDLFGSRGAA